MIKLIAVHFKISFYAIALFFAIDAIAWVPAFAGMTEAGSGSGNGKIRGDPNRVSIN